MSSTSTIASAQRTLALEATAIEALIPLLDQQFDTSCSILLECTGRVVVTGMGKSGHIANKIAATLASTGTPAFFVHPGEASHGDLGMITKNDVLIALSNSGNTVELVNLIPLIKRLKTPLIAMTGDAHSQLAQAADCHINVGVKQEACPLGLAPTASTTATLAMGDAIAVALLELRGFTAEDFAFSHPGGALGRKLLLKVGDVMLADDRTPAVLANCTIKNALFEITQKGLGMTTVINTDKLLLGIYTDGDLRRSLDKEININTTLVESEMTTEYSTCNASMLAAEALGIMEAKNISALPVTTETNQVIGVIHLHDLIKAGLA